MDVLEEISLIISRTMSVYKLFNMEWLKYLQANKFYDFIDENGKMTLSVKDVDGEILSIPQFTLYATLESGNRPSFARALAKPKASLLYQYFNEMLNKEIKTKTGVFGANMQISSINDGPVTIVIER